MHGQFYVFICGVSVSHLIYWLFSRPPENSFSWAINTRFHTTAYGNIYIYSFIAISYAFFSNTIACLFDIYKAEMRFIQRNTSNRFASPDWNSFNLKSNFRKMRWIVESKNKPSRQIYERRLRIQWTCIEVSGVLDFLATLFRTSSI